MTKSRGWTKERKERIRKTLEAKKALANQNKPHEGLSKLNEIAGDASRSINLTPRLLRKTVESLYSDGSSYVDVQTFSLNKES